MGGGTGWGVAGGQPFTGRGRRPELGASGMGRCNWVYPGFLGVTVVKVVAAALLGWFGVVEPFVGANAQDHYLTIADRLLAEGRFNGPDSRVDSKVPVGYPAFLAAVKGLLPGSALWAVVGIQMAADLLVACGLYRLARRHATPAAGVLAGFAWLLFPPAVVFSTWVTAETLFTALLLLSLSLLVNVLQRPAPAGALAAGLTLGVATLFRGTCVWLPVFLLPLWLSRGWSRRLLMGLAFTAGVAAVVAPWAVRNRVVLGDPILVSVGAGSAFLQGSDERVFTIAGKRALYPDMADAARRAGVPAPANDHESAVDHFMLRVGLHNYAVRWRERPWTFLPFGLHKLVRMWYGTESGEALHEAGLAFVAVFVVPLGLWQIWRWRTGRPVLAWVFGLVALYFIGLHEAVLPQYRYLHPIYPLLILGASHVVVGRCGRGRAAPRRVSAPARAARGAAAPQII